MISVPASAEPGAPSSCHFTFKFSQEPKIATPTVCPSERVKVFSAVEAPRWLCSTEDWAIMVNTIEA
ncbi:hypothetical protein D3C73_1274780 [compost metagenome]